MMLAGKQNPRKWRAALPSQALGVIQTPGLTGASGTPDRTTRPPPTASQLVKWREVLPLVRRACVSIILGRIAESVGGEGTVDRDCQDIPDDHLDKLNWSPYPFETELCSPYRPTDRVDVIVILRGFLRRSKRPAGSSPRLRPVRRVRPSARDQLFEAGSAPRPSAGLG